MAVNEALSALSTTASSNTPAGTDNIGTELDDHLRDIKKNVRYASNLPAQAAKITAYTVVATDHNTLLQVDASASAVTVTLLAAATAGDGFKIGVKKLDAVNTVTVDGNASETIDGSVTTALTTQYRVKTLVCDGTNWKIKSDYDFNPTSGLMTDVFTTRGDLLRAGVAGAEERLALGTVDKYVRSDGTDSVWSYPPLITQNVLAPHKNLVCKYVTAATVDIDADNILLLDSAGGAFNAASVNLTLNLASSGALGLDTGAEAISTWYHLWVLAKRDGTITGVFSVATAFASVTKPTDYVYGGYVGTIYNDSGSNFDFMHQVGKNVNAEDKSALSGGSSATYASVNLAAIVPSTATSVGGYIGSADSGSGSGQITVAPSNNANDHGMVRSSSRSGTVGGEISPFELTLETAQTIYYLVGVTDSGDINITKWGY